MPKGKQTAGVLLLIGALVIGFVVFQLSPLLNRFFPKPKILSTSTVITQVQSLSELVTVKYVLEKVIIFEDVKWYGESKVLMVAHGIVKAGVDLGQLKAEDVQITDKRIVVHLPKEKITDVYLDDKRTEILERSTGVLREFDKDLEQNARREAVEQIRSAAKSAGILKDARERAQIQLKRLFTDLGFTEVEIK